jgi:hypothetical protein
MKVLVASPTADVKSYCFDRWMEHVKSLTYDGDYDIYICDNSDSRDFMVESRAKYSDLGERFVMERLSPIQYKSISDVMAKSHDKCRKRVLDEGYDYLLHLETDVFPPLDVIERLLDHNTKIVGGVYHIELGEQSTLMIQAIEDFGTEHRETFNLDESDLSFIDGTVKQVFSCGLGCVLIHRSVLEKLSFRYEEGASVHPDSFFYGDLKQLNIPVFVDTSLYCEHDNKSMTRVS